ncbi:MAG: hypothetical protein KatS3mg059_1099 [Thermomicrobiales bacterium]|nr:MAG: hypothetical protein KatS3mg059_1099 [Thermomicrobiales bacterium]
MKPHVHACVVHDNAITLIECERNGQRSSVFPGGGPRAGDAFAKATKQEVFEETGLAVETSGPVAKNVSCGVPNILVPARMTGSSLATGTGRELTTLPDPRLGLDPARVDPGRRHGTPARCAAISGGAGANSRRAGSRC